MQILPCVRGLYNVVFRGLRGLNPRDPCCVALRSAFASQKRWRNSRRNCYIAGGI